MAGSRTNPRLQSSKVHSDGSGDPGASRTHAPAGTASYCSLTRRLMAMIYDAIIVVALLFTVAALALPVTGGRYVALRDPAYTMYLLLPWAAYFGWCWTHGGTTLGMRAWKIRLVGLNGRPVGWGRSLARFGLAWISALPLGLGFAWSAFDRDRLAWHDRWSGTRLVRNTG